MSDYWEIDTNRWSKSKYTEEGAKVLSGTLVNCRNMTDCSYCSDSSYCSSSSCLSFCSFCSRCLRCLRCSGISDCSFCSYCSDSSDCSGISRCSYCSGFDHQPHQYSTPVMGRDDRVNFLHWSDKKHQVTCGCFKGTIDELEKRVEEVHGDNEHGEAYRKQIKIMRGLLEMTA